MAPLLAGAARVNITPYVGAFLAGFAGRDHGSEGVGDELHARAVVLEAGETTAALVACDLIGLSEASVAAIRERVEQATGIPGGHVMVACTHTHSGPTMGILRHPGLDVELVHVTERKIAGAVIAAHRGLRRAALGVGTGQARIGINRRQRRLNGSAGIGQNPAGPIDETVLAVRIDDAERGEPLALIVGHACHPVVLAGQNYLISADYPGQTAAFVEEACPGAVCLFVNGAFGDINPEVVGGTFEDARRLGRVVAAEALRVAGGIEPHAEAAVAVAGQTVEAPLAGLPPADELHQLIENRTWELDGQLAQRRISRERREDDQLLGWARDALAEWDKPRRPASRPLELQGLRLGDGLLVGMPGETFVEIGAAVRAAAPLAATFVVGCANGNVGYIPTARAFAEGGYEVEGAPKFYRGIYAFAPGVEQAVVSGAIEVAEGLAAPPA